MGENRAGTEVVAPKGSWEPLMRSRHVTLQKRDLACHVCKTDNHVGASLITNNETLGRSAPKLDQMSSAKVSRQTLRCLLSVFV